jgi:DNA (cytosine-5)-methyltransferase 1
MLETIHFSKPKIRILENVRGFTHIEKGVPYRQLVDFLKKENYIVNAYIYNTKDYGIPQNRERVYIVCIRKDVSIKEYIKPKPKKMKTF